MKISSVKTATVKGNFEWIIVRVHTDEGIVGYGEAYWGVGVTTVIEAMGRGLVGQDPMNVDKLYQSMHRGWSCCGSIGGVVVTAISGIEMALLDIAGKALNTPVHNLLGGKYRDKIRLYADCGGGELRDSKGFTDPEAFAERARTVQNQGYTALKFDIDGPTPLKLDPWNRCLAPAEIRHMVDLVRAVREGVGDVVDVAIDCHWSYNVPDAIRLACALEEFNLMWLEDPVPPENPRAIAKVAAATKTPICTGENLYTRYGFRELIEAQAVSVLSPDIPKVGGVFETRRIADMADVNYIPLAPHNVSTPIGAAAAAHACASFPNFLALEFHSLDVEWWNDMALGQAPMIVNGYLTVPDGPGLGVELNEDVARRYAKPGEVFFE